MRELEQKSSFAYIPSWELSTSKLQLFRGPSPHTKGPRHCDGRQWEKVTSSVCRTHWLVLCTKNCLAQTTGFDDDGSDGVTEGEEAEEEEEVVVATEKVKEKGQRWGGWKKGVGGGLEDLKMFL